ncbi:hypothetical protein GVAV_001087 [Gurleya vavrai]
MELITVGNKKIRIHDKLREITCFSIYDIIFTNRSIIFNDTFPFTINLKPFSYFISNRGIFYKENNKNIIYFLKNPYQLPELILETDKNFVGILDNFIILCENSFIFFHDLETPTIFYKKEISRLRKVIIYLDKLVAITSDAILFINQNVEFYNYKNANLIKFEKFLMFIENLVFFKNKCIGEKKRNFEMNNFEEDIFNLFNENEKCIFLNNYFLSEQKTCSIFENMIISNKTSLKIINLLIYKILNGKSKDVFMEIVFIHRFKNSNLNDFMSNLKNLEENGANYKKIFLYDNSFIKQVEEIKKNVYIYNKVFDLISLKEEYFTYFNDQKYEIPLPYKIIEKNEKRKNIKKSNKSFDDTRLNEVEILLNDKEIGTFSYDEFDLEKKGKPLL